MERLERQPAIVKVGPDISVVVGKWDLQKRIADVMGRGSGMRQLPAAIYEMLSGDFTDLGRWAYGYRRAISLSAMAVTMDCASFASAARLERIQREAPNTILGAVIDFPFRPFATDSTYRGSAMSSGRRCALPCRCSLSAARWMVVRRSATLKKWRPVPESSASHR